MPTQIPAAHKKIMTVVRAILREAAQGQEVYKIEYDTRGLKGQGPAIRGMFLSHDAHKGVMGDRTNTPVQRQEIKKLKAIAKTKLAPYMEYIEEFDADRWTESMGAGWKIKLWVGLYPVAGDPAFQAVKNLMDVLPAAASEAARRHGIKGSPKIKPPTSSMDKWYFEINFNRRPCMSVRVGREGKKIEIRASIEDLPKGWTYDESYVGKYPRWEGSILTTPENAQNALLRLVKNLKLRPPKRGSASPPIEVAQKLRKIADKIDRSKQPYASAVEKELREVLANLPE